MTTIDNKNILGNKYKTNNSLTMSMLFVGFYTLIIAFATNNFSLFLPSIGGIILFILSFIFFILLFGTHIYLLFLNRTINPTQAIIQNIKKINIIFLSIIYIRVVILIIAIPLQLALVAFLLNEKLQKYYYAIVIICSVLSVCSISIGVYNYIKKREKIKIFKDELIEIRE